MDTSYPIYMGNEIVGEAVLTHSGLYWQVDCHCQFQGTTIEKIVVICKDGPINIGVCKPTGNGMHCHTKISKRQLATLEKFQILGTPQGQKLTEGEKLPSLKGIGQSHIEIRDGGLWLVIPQAPEYNHPRA